jgi:molecular chaperone HtpG
MAKREFQTEVSQLLQLIIHSLYSHPEIFLRELISNSSDALDKLRHLTLTDDLYKAVPFDPRIDLDLDEEAKTLVIADTGIGMSEDDLASNLGTIARSGTKNFLSQLVGRREEGFEPDWAVWRGFYSVHGGGQDRSGLRKAGEESGLAVDLRREDRALRLERRAERCAAGTTVLLHLNEEGKQYANSWRLQEIVKKYSNHIAFPIFPHLRQERVECGREEVDQDAHDRAGECGERDVAAVEERAEGRGLQGVVQVDHRGFGGSAVLVSYQGGGALEYTTLFYIPAKAPLDLYNADYTGLGVKLYVKRVFIMDDAKELLPQYLRFVRGIIDSEDLPLNVSREILQQNKVLTSSRRRA